MSFRINSKPTLVLYGIHAEFIRRTATTITEPIALDTALGAGGIYLPYVLALMSMIGPFKTYCTLTVPLALLGLARQPIDILNNDSAVVGIGIGVVEH